MALIHIRDFLATFYVHNARASFICWDVIKDPAFGECSDSAPLVYLYVEVRDQEGLGVFY